MNPLVSAGLVELLLHRVFRGAELAALPDFAGQDLELWDQVIATARQFARDELFPGYRAIDAEPPRFCDGQVTVHPLLRQQLPALFATGLHCASRPEAVGGQGLPLLVTTLATAYLMAGNLSVYGYAGLTVGAAHLIEAFGSPQLKRDFMAPMYAGRWTGTMALTEPQAGSSLTDVKMRATPAGEHFLMSGAKIFISGGEHDVSENIVHLALARLPDAPPGIKGVSLFCVPRRRPEGGQLVDNDVRTTGLIHKIGWRGLPSLALAFGERGDCHGWLVGEPNRGIAHMFQMMNEARIMVGLNATATASVAYHEALRYARERPQGRSLASRDPNSPQVPIIQHADVRRMLLEQKCIVEGSLALLCRAARAADLAEHAPDPAVREHNQHLLDVLTPVAKSWPAEHGYRANTLAVQVHGGYGYSSEYLPEAWLRDQKLNSLHEGTTGIHALDLLGRRVVARGGQPLRVVGQEIAATVARARAAGVPGAWCQAVEQAFARVGSVTMALAGFGLGGDAERMLRQASDYLELFGVVAIAWQWLELAAATHETGAPDPGLLAAAQHFIVSELPRFELHAARCEGGDDAYAALDPDRLS